MHLKSEIIKIMINDKADKVKEQLFQSLLFRYQIGQEELMIVFIYCIKNVIEFK